MDMHRLSKLSLIGILAVLLVALGVAGCGGDSSSSSETSGASESGEISESSETGAGEENAEVVAAAKKIAEGAKEVTEIGPRSAIKNPIPKEKYVIYVACPEQACRTMSVAFEEAADLLGWKAETLETEYTPQAVQNAFDEVIRRHPDGVTSAGLGPAAYPRQLAELDKMGVVVGETTGEVNGGEEGIAFDPIGPDLASKFMRILANQTISEIGGEGLVGTVMLTESPIVADYTQAYEEEIEEKCPACETTRIEIAPTDLGKDSAEKIVNFIRANSPMKAMFYSYDPFGEGVPSALKVAGIEPPKTYSWGVDAPGIEALNNGERTAAAPLPYNEAAWQNVDSFARAFTGEDPQQPFQDPIIWSKEYGNIPTQTEPYPTIVSDYKEEFEKLWGLK